MADNYMEPTPMQIEHGGKAKAAFNEAANPPLSPPPNTAINDGPSPPDANVQKDRQTQPDLTYEMKGPDGDRMREAVRQNDKSKGNDKGQREAGQQANSAKAEKVSIKDTLFYKAMQAEISRREAEKSLNLENESDKGR